MRNSRVVSYIRQCIAVICLLPHRPDLWARSAQWDPSPRPDRNGIPFRPSPPADPQPHCKTPPCPAAPRRYLHSHLPSKVPLSLQHRSQYTHLDFSRVLGSTWAGRNTRVPNHWSFGRKLLLPKLPPPRLPLLLDVPLGFSILVSVAARAPVCRYGLVVLDGHGRDPVSESLDDSLLPL